MADRRRLKVDVDVDTKKASKNIKDFEKSGLASAGALAVKFAAVAVAVAGIYKAGQSLIRWQKENINLAQKQIKAEQDYAAALRARGLNAEKGLALAKAQTSAWQQQILVGDEVQLAIGAQIATMAELNEKQYPQAIKATLQLAEAQKMDGKAAAVLVGKALDGYTSALTRYGIQLDSSASKQEILDAILEKTAVAWDVMAERTNTVEGATVKLNNSWGDLRETFGMGTAGSPEMAIAINAIADAISNVNTALSDSGKPGTWAAAVATAMLTVADQIITISENLGSLANYLHSFTTLEGTMQRMSLKPFKGPLKGPYSNIDFSAAHESIRDALFRLNDPFEAVGPSRYNANRGGGGGGGAPGSGPAAAAAAAAASQRLRPGIDTALSISRGRQLFQPEINIANPVYGNPPPGMTISKPAPQYLPRIRQVGQPATPTDFWDTRLGQVAIGAAGGLGGGLGGILGGGASAFIGSAIGGPLGGILGGLGGGFVSKLFGGGKKRGETPAQPLYVKDVQLQDTMASFLAVAQQSLAGRAGTGIDALSNYRLAQAGVGVR